MRRLIRGGAYSSKYGNGIYSVFFFSSAFNDYIKPMVIFSPAFTICVGSCNCLCLPVIRLILGIMLSNDKFKTPVLNRLVYCRIPNFPLTVESILNLHITEARQLI